MHLHLLRIATLHADTGFPVKILQESVPGVQLFKELATTTEKLALRILC